MKQKKLHIRFFRGSFLLIILLLAIGCYPTNGNSTPDYPYFITTKPIAVKKIWVPAGTYLVYEESFFRKGKQDEMLDEEKLTDIKLQNGATVNWAGVPVKWIAKFFNQEMHGFTVYADFSKLSSNKKNKFTGLWESCSDGLGITVKSLDDWSFNTKNIANVESCGTNYQRYFKENKEQQTFLDELYSEIMKKDAESNLK